MRKYFYFLSFLATASFISCEKNNSPATVILSSGQNNLGIIHTIAGNGTTGYSGDGGIATAAELYYPFGVAVDASGNIYIADVDNSRVRKVNLNGIISTFAGNGFFGFSGDGGQATAAEFYYPVGVATDDYGNVYIADGEDSRIRKVTPGGIISTIAGNGFFGFSGDGGPATVAELYYPLGVAVDASGNVYVADEENSRIRMINTSGIISTFAGNGYFGYSGDGGPATTAELTYPSSVAADAYGNIYIADRGNNRIRLVNAAANISTLAGNGFASFSGDGGQAASAELDNPLGVTCRSGVIYIADEGNQRVRMVSESGIISTIAGNGTFGYSGDGGQATAAELFDPAGITVDVYGNVYFSDEENQRVRKVLR